MTDEDAYVREAAAAAFHWYQQADTKAQVLLGFSGVFLSIIIASLLSIESGQAITGKPHIVTIVGAVMLGNILAIVLSVMALWSHGIWFDNTKSVEFFGRISNYSSSDLFAEAVKVTSDDQLLRMKLASLHKLARYTAHKHRFVDAAAIVSCLSLFGTVVAAIYILRT